MSNPLKWSTLSPAKRSKVISEAFAIVPENECPCGSPHCDQKLVYPDFNSLDALMALAKDKVRATIEEKIWSEGFKVTLRYIETDEFVDAHAKTAVDALAVALLRFAGRSVEL